MFFCREDCAFSFGTNYFHSIINSSNRCVRGQENHSKEFDFMREIKTEARSVSDAITNDNVSMSQDEDNSRSVEITAPSHFGSPSPLHKVHVQPMLTKEEVTKCLQIAAEFAENSESWEKLSDRHTTYKTNDFEISDCTELSSYMDGIDFHNRIKDKLSKAYHVDPEDMEYFDFFCARYEAATSTLDSDPANKSRTIDRLEFHRDETLLSFSVLLSDPSDSFEGGGTVFDCLRDVSSPTTPETSEPRVLCKGGVVRPSRQGDCVLHSGKMLHGADVVTAGSRTVFVGFVDVARWVQTQGVLATASREWGRLDVAKARAERQLKMTNGGKEAGWNLSDRVSRWLPKQSPRNESIGRSHITGYSPSFLSVEKRAESEFQRLERLRIEDNLLHNAFLPRDNRSSKLNNGDIIIL